MPNVFLNFLKIKKKQVISEFLALNYTGDKLFLIKYNKMERIL